MLFTPLPIAPAEAPIALRLHELRNDGLAFCSFAPTSPTSNTAASSTLGDDDDHSSVTQEGEEEVGEKLRRGQQVVRIMTAVQEAKVVDGRNLRGVGRQRAIPMFGDTALGGVRVVMPKICMSFFSLALLVSMD